MKQTVVNTVPEIHLEGQLERTHKVPASQADAPSEVPGTGSKHVE